MKEVNDGGPAFPCVDARGFVSTGMSLRNYLIGQALVGLFADPHGSHRSRRERARLAIIQADEVLEALEADARCRSEEASNVTGK